VRRAFAIEIARTTDRALGKKKNHPFFSSSPGAVKIEADARAKRAFSLFSILRSLFGDLIE